MNYGFSRVHPMDMPSVFKNLRHEKNVFALNGGFACVIGQKKLIVERDWHA